ncbi:MAG: NAD(P)-dependent oxidoreductase [Planctomycetales bacterium]|nr:NAD(P)-dependent oxidoreductase [Planctomycetales bacterium]
MTKRSILVTGASGFIGRRTVDAFRASGWNVWGIGRRKLADTRYLAWDLSQPLDDSAQSKLRDVEVIIHAAARSSPWGNAKQFYLDNVLATHQVIRLAEQLQIGKLIFVSSSSVYYRSHDQFQINESTPLAESPVNYYARSKQQAESAIRSFPGPWCILRPRAVYGCGDTVLFPRLLTAAKAGRLPLLVRPGAPVTGDLLSVNNLTNCLLQAAQRPDLLGEFNLTDNQPIELIPFLLDVFKRLNIETPKYRVSTAMAFRVAWLLETYYRVFLPSREPPITRFGVHVFAYSKTFDVSKMLATFGRPVQTVEQAVDQFVHWVRQTDAYGLYS